MCTANPDDKHELKKELRKTMAQLDKSIEKANKSFCDSIFYYFKTPKK